MNRYVEEFMITLFRMIRLLQLRTKWQLALYQLLDQSAATIIKNPEELEKKILPYLAELVHATTLTQDK